MKMNIDPNDIQIKIKLLKSEATLAQVTVILFGEWVEKGWRISKSRIEHPTFHEYLWIQTPSYSTGYGKWQDIVFIENKRLYEEVQAKIFDAYQREKNKENIVTDFDEIDPKEVDKLNA